MPNRSWLILAALAAVAATVVLLRLTVGGGGLSLPESGIIWELRGQRVLAGAVVGVALAVAGVMLQSLLRNPLASPDLLGLASGAGLAVMVAMVVGGGGENGAQLQAPIHGHAPAAVFGSLAALALVYTLSQRRGFIEPVSLILVGVIVGIMCAAFTQLLVWVNPNLMAAATRLIVGSLNDNESWGRLAVTGAIVLAGAGYAIWLAPAMDAASLSDDEARSVGVRLGSLRLGLFIASGVLTAVAVMLAGMIGFVGLICPHLIRLLAGPSHRVVVIGAALAGIALVVGADTGVMAIKLQAGRLPIGVITALIGGPVFIWLLRKDQGGKSR